MLHLPIPSVIERIQSETGLSKDEIKEKISAKMKSMDGLVSEEGAAYIVASELGVHLFRERTNYSEPVKIGTILAGMMSVDVVGKVTRIFAAKGFTTKDGRKSKVGSFVLADDTGTIRVVLWDRKADVLEKMKSDMIVKVRESYAKLNNLNKVELNVGNKGSLILEPRGVNIEISNKTDIKKISEVAADESAALRGTVVQVFAPRLYPVCPKCGKKVVIAPEGAVCSEHKTVEPQQAMLLSLVLDDSTDTMRAVAFRGTAEKLAGLSTKDVQEILAKDGPVVLQERTEDALLGRVIEISGRTKQNLNREQIEFMISDTNLNPNPVQIANSMLKGDKHA
ncbi:MAG: OB-fold nucleic acid binding domain-containing protein [archaeon]